MHTRTRPIGIAPKSTAAPRLARTLLGTRFQIVDAHACLKPTQSQENALDFIRSVDAIVTVRGELKRLDGVSEGINARLQTTGKKYSEAAHRMLELRHVQTNLESAGSALEECVAVLALCDKADKLMAQDKFLSALKVSDRQTHPPSDLPGTPILIFPEVASLLMILLQPPPALCSFPCGPFQIESNRTSTAVLLWYNAQRSSFFDDFSSTKVPKMVLDDSIIRSCRLSQRMRPGGRCLSHFQLD